jgi:hypothetical protein
VRRSSAALACVFFALGLSAFAEAVASLDEGPLLVALRISVGDGGRTFSDTEASLAAGLGEPFSVARLESAMALVADKYCLRSLTFSTSEVEGGLAVLLQGRGCADFRLGWDANLAMGFMGARADDGQRVGVFHAAPYRLMLNPSLALTQLYILNKFELLTEWDDRPYPMRAFPDAPLHPTFLVSGMAGHLFVLEGATRLALGLQAGQSLAAADLSPRAFAAGPVATLRLGNDTGAFSAILGAGLKADAKGGAEAVARATASFRGTVTQGDDLSVSLWAGLSLAEAAGGFLVFDEYRVNPISFTRPPATDLAFLGGRIVSAPFVQTMASPAAVNADITYWSRAWDAVPLSRPSLFASADASVAGASLASASVGAGLGLTLTLFGDMKLRLLKAGVYLDLKTLLETSMPVWEFRVYAGG